MIFFYKIKNGVKEIRVIRTIRYNSCKMALKQCFQLLIRINYVSFRITFMSFRIAFMSYRIAFMGTVHKSVSNFFMRSNVRGLFATIKKDPSV
jgi:hypothetical protein